MNRALHQRAVPSPLRKATGTRHMGTTIIGGVELAIDIYEQDSALGALELYSCSATMRKIRGSDTGSYVRRAPVPTTSVGSTRHILAVTAGLSGAGSADRGWYLPLSCCPSPNLQP